MPEVKKCPKCGAQNAATAEWCTLCLTRFEKAPAPEPGPAPAPEPDLSDELAALGGTPAEVPPSAERISGGNGDQRSAVAEETPLPEPNGEGGPAFVSAPPPPVRDVPVRFVRDGERVRWICPACETANEVEASACRICGTVMARLFQPEEAKAASATKPAGKAMALSAALPGLGHIYTGSTATGLSRAGMFGWTLVIGVLFLVRTPAHAHGLLRAIGIIFTVAAAAVWGMSMIEAGRCAEGDRTPVVQTRTMTWVSAALVVVLFIGLIAAAFSRG